MQKNRRGKRGRDWAGYAMILPSYSIYFVFTILPLFCTVWYSLTDFNGFSISEVVWFKNYIRMFRDEIFMKAVGNTLIYSLFTIIPPIALGLLIAVFVNGKLFLNGFCRSAFYMPYVVSMVASATVWYWMYDVKDGVFNMILRALGLSPKNWLFSAGTAMGCIIVMSIWKVLGYNMIIYLSGLQGIPGDLYEAARIDGAGAVQQFFYITLPMLSSSTFFLFVMSCISSLNVFEQVSVLTGGGPANATTTIVHQIYSAAFKQYEMGYASAMAMLLVAVTLVITVFNFKYGNAADAADM
ncbi:MAG: sugar ABC transporter permease [Oscillospiraceae bacterium]|nr:sugar ABC transporter permease [Oscillospiraceae bacterium]